MRPKEDGRLSPSASWDPGFRPETPTRCLGATLPSLESTESLCRIRHVARGASRLPLPASHPCRQSGEALLYSHEQRPSAHDMKPLRLDPIPSTSTAKQPHRLTIPRRTFIPQIQILLSLQAHEPQGPSRATSPVLRSQHLSRSPCGRQGRLREKSRSPPTSVFLPCLPVIIWETVHNSCTLRPSAHL